MHTLAQLRSGALTGLRRLELREALTEFPREIFTLADTLEVLDLSDNLLTELPDDLHRLPHLQAVFASNNRFTRVPEGLGACAALTQIGLKANRITELPAAALPPRLRWLTLTDNALTALPDELGHRPLQKLMLAGNRLTHLPDSLAGHVTLELLRLAANPLRTLPAWLPQLPRLSWLALAGHQLGWPQAEPAPLPVAEWADLQVGEVLGQGASGVIHRARWQPAGAPAQDVALKLFKGGMTSDGLPADEMAAAVAAGDHPHLVGVLARLHGHPQATQGLLMPLLPPGQVTLAGPPSLASCTRDVYPPELRLTPRALHTLTLGVAQAVAHLHARGLLHGDLYAHNLHWHPDGDHHPEAVRLGDFGAATRLPADDPALTVALQALEVRAYGVLLEELLSRVDPGEPSAAVAVMQQLCRECLQPASVNRPSLAQVVAALAAA